MSRRLNRGQRLGPLVLADVPDDNERPDSVAVTRWLVREHEGCAHANFEVVRATGQDTAAAASAAAGSDDPGAGVKPDTVVPQVRGERLAQAPGCARR